MSSDIVRVLVVDDHAVLRSGLRLLLEREPGLEFAGEAASAEEAQDEDYEEEWEDVEIGELYPPHGRRGTYTAPDEEGWRLVTRLPFRPPHGEMTEAQLHQMYLDRGNQNDEDEQDVNGDLTDRNQRREFY